MIRVVFRANDNGQEFPVFFEKAEAVAEASERLNSVEISRQPSSEAEMKLEQLFFFFTAGRPTYVEREG
jgi:hypothetical protein